MNLSDLATYAWETYHLQERHSWAENHGVSSLTDAKTNRHAALLIRQEDPRTGEMIEYCDIRCGRDLLEKAFPGDHTPFIMEGPDWGSIIIDPWTPRDNVFDFLDRAVALIREPAPDEPFPDNVPHVPKRVRLPGEKPARKRPVTKHRGKRAQAPAEDPASVPEKIRQMRTLVQYPESTFEGRCANFCLQAKFMKDYTSDAPWQAPGAFVPAKGYDGLNTDQLPGYFNWRAHVRRNDFPAALDAYIRIYFGELLCDIGTTSPQDALRKMQAFEAGYPWDKIPSCYSPHDQVRLWIRDYAIINGFPSDVVLQYTDPEILERDRKLLILKSPQNYSDEDVFSVLRDYGSDRTDPSLAVKKGGAEAMHLYAAVWRYALQTYSDRGRDLFTTCFKSLEYGEWDPFPGVYWVKHAVPRSDFVLDDWCSFHFHDDRWTVETSQVSSTGIDMIESLTDETERLLRKKFKTGGHYKQQPSSKWATPYVSAVLEGYDPSRATFSGEVSIDFSRLEKIRQDAAATRESLLTEEPADTEDSGREAGTAEAMEEPAETSDAGAALHASGSPAPSPGSSPGSSPAPASSVPGLLPLHRQILRKLLAGMPIREDLRAAGLLPSVVTDAINDALYDAIGDSVLECTGDEILMVEDYREDVRALLEGPG